jgi:Protein of unknown function (DUF3467)
MEHSSFAILHLLSSIFVSTFARHLQTCYHPDVSETTNNPSPFGDADKPRTENFSHTPVAARVPEKVSKGIFCTGQVILDGPKEFVIDFLQGLTRPFQVVQRVVMTPDTVKELTGALQQNLDMYAKQYGPPPPPPGPVPDRRPTIQEIYENFRLPEEMLSGTYANSVLIGHSPTEFFFDFITGFYPTSAVAARIFLPCQQVPRFLNALNSSVQQHKQRYKKEEE